MDGAYSECAHFTGEEMEVKGLIQGNSAALSVQSGFQDSSGHVLCQLCATLVAAPEMVAVAFTQCGQATNCIQQESREGGWGQLVKSLECLAKELLPPIPSLY